MALPLLPDAEGQVAQEAQQVWYYQEYAPHIFYAIWARLGRTANNFEVARDLTQETFLRALLRWDQFVPADETTTTLDAIQHQRVGWLYRIATNATIDHQRRWSTTHTSTGEVFENAVHELADPQDALQELAKREQAALVRVGVALSLTPLYEEVVKLWLDMDCPPYQTLADRLNLPCPTVKTRLYRAFATLRECPITKTAWQLAPL